ncbi:SMI1/KNR4 family protein [Actinacidiphila acididurans]|uniref:SMI1/KNR4 family protein n=1 Tax=Actinacidiphila acididurans TaxID=2784346 RepID=A0ABS2TZB5_9ACTN|nr:SMI1/KNR4 family protein [Actinacidiphila acididurans]MBM9508669.1 SMI1/KNR4 family protein [Actinacidiphila acididurans]
MKDMSPEDPPRTAEDWRGYLAEYGRLYVATANEYQYENLTAEQIESGWLGAGPAGEQTIAAAEQRLGIRFPPSLRAFLSVTDGWQGLGAWVAGVSPCAGIDWMRNIEDGMDLINLYAAANEGDDGGPEELLTLFRRALLIAGGEEDFWLLDPAQPGPDGEWTAYEFQPKYGEADEYPSFAELFHASKELMTAED